MLVTLKKCRNLQVLDFIKQGYKSFPELVGIVKTIPEYDDARYLAAIGLVYVLVTKENNNNTEEQLEALKYFIGASGNDVSSWDFNPKEFGGIENKKINLLSYIFLHCSSVPKIRLLIKETRGFLHLQRVIAHLPRSLISLDKLKWVLDIFKDENINLLFSQDESFNITEPNLLLHYFVNDSDIVNLLVDLYGANIETVNAIGFDFITYGMVKNQYGVVLEQIKKRYGDKCDLAQLVRAYKYLCRVDDKNLLTTGNSHPLAEWSIFLKMKNTVLNYYGYHPVFPFILQKLQNLTNHLDYRNKNYIRASLIDPLVQYLKNSRSINYKAIELLRCVLENNIKGNDCIKNKDLTNLEDIISKLNINVNKNILHFKRLQENNYCTL